MQMKQKLILEGMNDVHVISNLLVAKNLDVTSYEDGVRVITLSKSPIAGPFKIPFEIVQGGVQARTALIVRT